MLNIQIAAGVSHLPIKLNLSIIRLIKLHHRRENDELIYTFVYFSHLNFRIELLFQVVLSIITEL